MPPVQEALARSWGAMGGEMRLATAHSAFAIRQGLAVSTASALPLMIVPSTPMVHASGAAVIPKGTPFANRHFRKFLPQHIVCVGQTNVPQMGCAQRNATFTLAHRVTFLAVAIRNALEVWAVLSADAIRAAVLWMEVACQSKPWNHQFLHESH